MSGITKFSDVVKGEDRNYNWSVRFDKSGGRVGITQERGQPLPPARVLLSKKQYQALVEFVGPSGLRQKRKRRE